MLVARYGSVGDFTDINQDAEITSEMQCDSFPVQRLIGEFYAHISFRHQVLSES